VNRKQRRIAAKLGKQVDPSAAPATTVGSSFRVAELLAAAQQLKQQGKIDQAVDRYRWALALEPDNAEVHYSLGNALRLQNKLDEAAAHYHRAIELRSNFAEAHNNFGNVLRRQGKLDEAVSHYQRAVTLKPNFAEAYINLGNAFQDQGRADEAESQYRRALALNPDFAEAHSNLANVLNRQGKLDEAVLEYQRALALKPDYAEAHNNLGTALQYQGKTAEAVGHYRRALTLVPDYAEAQCNLAKALMDAGDSTEALKAIQRSIKIEGSENAKLLFVQCLRDLNSIPDGVDLRDDLIRALSEPWGRPSDLARFTTNFLRLNGTTSVCIRRVASAWPRRLPPQEIFSPGELAEIADDKLLRCLLETTIICDIELERFLTAARHTMLEAVSAGVYSEQVEKDALHFFCALAQQCYINEYVFACTDRDIEQADRLRTLLVKALTSGDTNLEHWLVAVAAFFPLASVPGADLLVERRWSAPVAKLVDHHLRDGEEERQLRASIPPLTSVENGVSLAVRQQYEENPYPRWMKAAPVGKPTTIDAYLRNKFPLVDLRNVDKRSGAEILIAGCGTGQHSIETAQRFSGAQVLAIDLSLTSLCYAKRKTHELGLNNIEYAQADIMQLRTIDRVFDVIEASGVLHHLADPLAGWQLLLSILRPGGFMRLGLYSELARQDLVAARTFIAQRGYGPSAPEIRRCREELTGFGSDSSLAKVSELVDFFSTSTCRDLLFHVHEHQLKLPDIDSFLRQNRLEFLGFDLPGNMLHNFRRRFPNDKPLTDLALWHVFETENPTIFVGMYQFWIRKS
jgi:tetratricopeptide (TPR) repeat protein/SAM-dependent methyltransferase